MEKSDKKINLDERLDNALEATFPCSDPVSLQSIIIPGRDITVKTRIRKQSEKKSKAGSSHPDSYSAAIPIDELAQLAKARARECSAHSEQDIRKCAEQVVRAKLCPCTLSVDSIVDAVVEEFRRQLGQ